MNRVQRKIFQVVRYGLNDIFKPAVKLNGNTILVFHGIDVEGNRRINSRFLSMYKFEKLICLLKKQADFISVKDMYAGRYNQHRPNIALTFDDGYKNNLTYLLPILEKYAIPASVYVTTIRTKGYQMLWTDCMDVSAYLDHSPFTLRGEMFVHTGSKGYKSTTSNVYLKETAKRNNWEYKEALMQSIPGACKIPLTPELYIYWELLSEQDIFTLSQSPLITIGSHAQLHNCLAESSHEEAMEELIVSKKYIENIIQKEVVELAYPDGSYTDQLALEAYQLGYKIQVLGDYLTEASKSFPFLVQRFITNPHISNYNQLFCIHKKRYY